MPILHNTTYNFIWNQKRHWKITVEFSNVFEATQALKLVSDKVLDAVFRILNSWISRYNPICIISTKIVSLSLHKMGELPRQFKLRENHSCLIASVSYGSNLVIKHSVLSTVTFAFSSCLQICIMYGECCKHQSNVRNHIYISWSRDNCTIL